MRRSIGIVVLVAVIGSALVYYGSNLSRAKATATFSMSEEDSATCDKLDSVVESWTTETENTN